jgi:hypothetical protein
MADVYVLDYSLLIKFIAGKASVQGEDEGDKDLSSCFLNGLYISNVQEEFRDRLVSDFNMFKVICNHDLRAAG